MSTNLKEQARFDARITKEQKQFFERAALAGGYRNLTDFVIRTIQDKAKEIIEDNEQIIASKKDSAIFFDAIVNAKKPNKALKDALKDYKVFMAKSK